jgi:glutathione synthase
MNILFIADPLATFKIYKDSTYAMMQEAQRRGHHVLACEPQDLLLEHGKLYAKVRAIELKAVVDPHSHDWWHEQGSELRPLIDMGAVIMRKDPPFDLEYLYATQLLQRAHEQGAKIFNHPQALRDHNEKLGITEFPEFTAPTIVTRDPARLRTFAQEHGFQAARRHGRRFDFSGPCRRSKPVGHH